MIVLKRNRKKNVWKQFKDWKQSSKINVSSAVKIVTGWWDELLIEVQSPIVKKNKHFLKHFLKSTKNK